MFRVNVTGTQCKMESTPFVSGIEEASTLSRGDLNGKASRKDSNRLKRSVKRRLNFTSGAFDEFLHGCSTAYDADDDDDDASPRKRNKLYVKEPKDMRVSSACRGMPYSSVYNGFLAPLSQKYRPTLSPNGVMPFSFHGAYPKVYFNETLDDVEKKIQNLQVSSHSSCKE